MCVLQSVYFVFYMNKCKQGTKLKNTKTGIYNDNNISRSFDDDDDYDDEKIKFLMISPMLEHVEEFGTK